MKKNKFFTFLAAIWWQKHAIPQLVTSAALWYAFCGNNAVFCTIFGIMAFYQFLAMVANMYARYQWDKIRGNFSDKLLEAERYKLHEKEKIVQDLERKADQIGAKMNDGIADDIDFFLRENKGQGGQNDDPSPK
jgi:hypothetical protein